MPKTKDKHCLIVGAGIGGLTAALALSQSQSQSQSQPRQSKRQSNVTVTVLEQATKLTEIGAGLQLSPNASKRLIALGLQPNLMEMAAFPQALHVRHAKNHHLLGNLPLGQAMVDRYGAPYITIHRADLQAILLAAVQATPTQLCFNTALLDYETQHTNHIQVIAHTQKGQVFQADALIGADGVHSQVYNLLHTKQALCQAKPFGLSPTGHTVYRALIAQKDLPIALRSQMVTVWLGANLHIVSYPVRAGELLNLVVIMNLNRISTNTNTSTMTTATAPLLQEVIKAGQLCSQLQSLISMIPISTWRVWQGHDRPPIVSAQAMAQGSVALLGDAAHPMRPYLAQGAAMAIEDASTLAQIIRSDYAAMTPMTQALQHYATLRWQRCALVQTKAVRQGKIFHATGLLQIARDASIALLGRRILETPWLYGG